MMKLFFWFTNNTIIMTQKL